MTSACLTMPSGSWRNASVAPTQPRQPGGRVGEGGVVAAGRQPGRLTRRSARVRAEIADVGADPPERGERVAHPGVGDVPLRIEVEGVTAEPLAGGAGLDPGQ